MSTKLQQLIATLVRPAQDLEDTLFDLLVKRAIDTAEGVQLDILGKIVGQAREGASDDIYKRYLRSRVLSNRSNGTPRALLKIARAVINDEDAVIAFDPQYPAAIVIRVEDISTSEDLVQVLLDNLNHGKTGGVRILLEYTDVDPADTFAFEGEEGLGFGDDDDAEEGGTFASVRE